MSNTPAAGLGKSAPGTDSVSDQLQGDNPADNVTNSAKGASDKASETVNGTADGAKDKAGGLLGGATDTAGKKSGGLKDSLKSTADGATKPVGDGAQKTKKTMPGRGGGATGKDPFGDLKAPSLPQIMSRC